MSDSDKQDNENKPLEPGGSTPPNVPTEPPAAPVSGAAAKGSVRPTESSKGGVDTEELDPGSEALTEALRISFGVLKIVMAAIIGLFILSGAYEVDSNEKAIELRFGKVKGVGQEAIIETGLHWKWPAPMEEVIKLPIMTQRELNVNAFWHNQPEDTQYTMETLRIGVDGYSVTAASGVADILPNISDIKGVQLNSDASSEVTDYNLVHTNWKLSYRIDEKDPIKFVQRLWDGTEGTPEEGGGWFEVRYFLNKIVSDAVVAVSANWDIERILWDDSIGFRDQVRQRITDRLNELDVGLVVTELDLVNIAPPLRLRGAFESGTQARSEKPRLENEAMGQASNIISQAETDAKLLLSGAQTYRDTKVSAAMADAQYMEEVLNTIEESTRKLVPEDEENYQQKRAQKKQEILILVLKEMQHQMLREILAQAEESFVLPAVDELRLHLNRDAEIDALPEADKQQATTMDIHQGQATTPPTAIR